LKPIIAGWYGSISTDPLLIASTFNSVFTSSFIHDNHNIQSVRLPLQSSCHISTIYFPVSAVIEQLKKLKSSKTITPDTFSSYTIKIFGLSIAKPLSLLFEFMFSRNYIPPEWKLAFINPTHKKGSRSDPNNYRPIANTSIICRIMERIIHAQLIN